ncbi:MAG: hypothetical protein ACR2JC_13255 [Chloroflexota bacterium]|nr:MAG: hypothetical protein DLM70_14950 [Chloroflexota bacterium]
MIWLTWRQQRLELMVAAAVLGLVTLVLLKTGLEMASAYQQTGVGPCISAQGKSNCFLVVEAFRNRFSSIVGLANWLNFLPLVFGLLLGAPLVLELEQGTYRLAWTQSITRTRWIAFKLAFVVAAALLLSVIFTAIMTWWHAPWNHLEGRFVPNAYDFEGVAPLAYAVFAVSLGIALGTIFRRTVPAMALSLFGYLALRLGIENIVRPHFVAPLTAVDIHSFRGSLPTQAHGGWIMQSGWSDRFGHSLSDNYVFQVCDPHLVVGVKSAMTACFRSHGIFDSIVYQPANRFWLFQGIETAIFGGVSAALLALTFVWIKYRVS